MTGMHADTQSEFAGALLDPARAVPEDVTSHTGPRPAKRFAVYRNNVTVSLVDALRARFPAIERLVGDEFFAAMACIFVREHPPRLPILSVYGDEFPDFLERFPPMAELPYAGDVARLEAARTRAYHAADAAPLPREALQDVAAASIAQIGFTLHPSLQIVRSRHPIVTIWAMNSGEMTAGPVDTGISEDALILRPLLAVAVRKLPAGGAAFLTALRDGKQLSQAAEAAFADSPSFDLTANLAGLFASGLVTALRPGPAEENDTP